MIANVRQAITIVPLPATLLFVWVTMPGCALLPSDYHKEVSGLELVEIVRKSPCTLFSVSSYKGRKDGYDYFHAAGCGGSYKVPVESSLETNPMPYTRDSRKWKRTIIDKYAMLLNMGRSIENVENDVEDIGGEYGSITTSVRGGRTTPTTNSTPATHQSAP